MKITAAARAVNLITSAIIHACTDVGTTGRERGTTGSERQIVIAACGLLVAGI